MNDIIGKKFGVLKILSHAYYDGKHHYYFAECENCNQSIIVHRNNLLNGRTKSCGCLKKIKEKKARKKRYKHGHIINGKRTPTYGSWFNMKQRCLNPNNPAYMRYGGRGITVCKRWMEFTNFLTDMGERPNNKTIDRIDNDGNYEPDNCKWSTISEQRKNNSYNIDKEELKKRKLEKRKRIKREETKRRKIEKLEKPLFRLHGSVIPFDYFRKDGKIYYKVLCKCRKPFVIYKGNMKDDMSCSFCGRKYRGRNTDFIKVKYTDKLKKAFDVLYDNGYIKTKKLAHIVRL